MRFLAQKTKDGDTIHHTIMACRVAMWKSARESVPCRNPEFVFCIPKLPSLHTSGDTK